MKTMAFLLVFTPILLANMLTAQAVNDECLMAIDLPIHGDSTVADYLAGDTRDASLSAQDMPLCADTTMQGDLWYRITLADTLPDHGFDIKAEFGNEPEDLQAIGFALYSACNGDLIQCHSAAGQDQAGIFVPTACLATGQSYLLRVWSIGTEAEDMGRFRITAFQRKLEFRVLWTETFAGGLEENGWISIGTCGEIDSSLNATWSYLPEGRLNRGSFTPNAIMGTPSICDGAVGVDSDFLDNLGNALNPDGTQNPEAFGTGPCPSFFPDNIAQYLLISPAIHIADWNVTALSLEFYQSIRSNGPSSYFISFRTREEEGDWSNWTNIEINEDLEDDGPFLRSDYQQHFLGGATAGDYLQIRFMYNAYYYVWGLDDISLIEAETHNLRVVGSRFAIPPHYTTPVDQHLPWIPAMDIFNAGSYFETGVTGVVDIEDAGGSILHTDTIRYEGLESIGLIENALFPEVVSNVPMSTGDFNGRYFVYSDSTNEENDFDFSDNSADFSFSQSTDLFAKENGYNRSISVASSIYDPGAPLSYTFGNYFFVKNLVGNYQLDVEWGVANAGELAGQEVGLRLYSWVDQNENEIVEADERKLLAEGEYVFTGDEENITTLNSTLKDPGAGDEGVLLDLENTALLLMAHFEPEDNTKQLFLLGSQELDYGPTVEAYRLSYPESGLGRHYSAVLGFHPGGNLEGIDYEVRDFDPGDERIFFGHHIIPYMRLQYQEASLVGEVGSDALQIVVNPSPVSDLLSLNLDGNSPIGNAVVRIHALDGALVYNKPFRMGSSGGQAIDVRHLPEGAYILSLHQDDEIGSSKFIIAR